MFLEVNFRCYLTHSISGSKIIVNFPLFTMAPFSLYRGLRRIAHLGEFDQDGPRERLALCLAALGAIGRILLQLRAKLIAICKV